MIAPQNRKVVLFVSAHVEDANSVRHLSVTEVMENDGEICGPEWGWITLGEIADRGYGVDTDPERWVLLNERADLVAGMRAYWDAHPEMADEEYSPPPTS